MSDIESKFKEFHEDNPKVYRDLVKMCRAYRAKGNTEKIGIGMLFEVLRWHRYIKTNSGDKFKLNNNFRSRYARKIMDENPDLKDIFNTRDLRS